MNKNLKKNIFTDYESAHTYVNPLSLTDIPRGKDDWYQYEKGMFSHENKPISVKGPDYRSISDPTVFYYNGKWYLYPSYGMAWMTEDFENWIYKKTSPYCPKYSPCITPWKGKFLLTSWCSPLYVGDTPLGDFRELGEFILLDGTTFVPCDPCIFTDDDGKIYLYEFKAETIHGEKGFNSVIVGYELDQENPRKVIQGPILVYRMNPKENQWERHGLFNQNPTFGWVEGPHLIKIKERYYLICAAPDTCYASYCMAVYYSDKGPLSMFMSQKRNPLTTHKNGIVSGAGHGCVERGPNNTLYAFYTIAAPYLHRYERRIGMDLVALDENGELYCPYGVTDTPQYIPGYKENPLIEDNSPNYVSLTTGIRPTASSCIEGRDALYSTDGSNLSFWQPSNMDQVPILECDLNAEYRVGAVRLWWREVGLDYQNKVIPAPIGYILEGYYNGKWFVLLDRRDIKEERNIDYCYFKPQICERVRLKITKWGKDLKIGVIDFSVFGKYNIK